MLQENCKSYEPTRIRKIERDPSKAKQEGMTQEKNKSFVEETRNTEEGVIFFRGEGCNIPLICPGIFCNFSYYCTHLGEELKAKVPPRQHLASNKS